MNRNLASRQGTALAALQNMTLWAPDSGADIRIAGCTDDQTLSETELLPYLSDAEHIKVNSLTDPAERRHLLFRRCFQRHFLAEILGWPGQIRELRVVHTLDSPPKVLDAPSLNVSFSSSGPTVLACASARHIVGIDVERIRPIQTPVGLAGRFFTPAEAARLAQLPENRQGLAFLHLWTAKEAGLKAVGKGIDSGLNRFAVNVRGQQYTIENTDENETDSAWSLYHTEFVTGHLVAVVHRRATD
jgi:phosphopantetheine--protein transferase-like protein